MGDSFIRWYREVELGSVFSDQVAEFGRFGISLTHPVTNVVTLVNVDGDDITVGLRELTWLIGLRIPSVTVNWWMSPDVSVLSTYSNEPLGCEVQTLWLDGLNSEEAEVVHAATLSTVNRVPAGTRALLSDTQGRTDAESWDSVILHGGCEIPGEIDSLLLSADISSRLLSRSVHLRGIEVSQTLTRVLSV